MTRIGFIACISVAIRSRLSSCARIALFSASILSSGWAAESFPEALVKYHQEKPMLMREYSPINHVSTKAPPIMLVYRTVGPVPASAESAAIHHAVFGFKLKEKLDAAGVPCILWIQDQSQAPPIPPNEFLLRQLRPTLFTGRAAPF
jgi:hypothetical protein